MANQVVGESATLNVPAVRGDGVNLGIVGTAQDGWAVSGESKRQVGVRGVCEDGWGVTGDSKTLAGVRGYCEPGDGVAGESKDGRGVHGISQTGAGVQGNSPSGRGVAGFSDTWQGVYGHSTGNAGVVGESEQLHGVYGDCHNPNGAGVYGTNNNGGFGVQGFSASGIGIIGTGGVLAGRFEGDVEVTGDIRLTNADCAEDFNIGSELSVEPGTVMVLGEEGALFPSQHAYDKRVAGVVSGAGDYKPGIVLDKQKSDSNRQPIALLGKVFCKVDAQFGAIEIGDLLTTSPTPGHAMKAADQIQAFGAVIGKALRPLAKGQQLIPILIALQ